MRVRHRRALRPDRVPGLGPPVHGRADDRQDGLAALRRHARGLEYVPGVLPVDPAVRIRRVRSRIWDPPRRRRPATCSTGLSGRRWDCCSPWPVRLPPLAPIPASTAALDPASRPLACSRPWRPLPLPARHGRDGGSARPELVPLDRTSPGARSLFPLRREQRGQPPRAAGLSVRDRAESEPGMRSPPLEDRIRRAGDVAPELRLDRAPHESRHALGGSMTSAPETAPSPRPDPLRDGAGVAGAGLHPVELADGRDDVPDDRPRADAVALGHPPGALPPELHRGLRRPGLRP